jgi:hypothetical protein
VLIATGAFFVPVIMNIESHHEETQAVTPGTA